MLKQEYNYVSIDFETTGLNTQKDDILQVWIVKFDHTGKMIDTYVSLIKPPETSKISTIVWYITWLEESDFTDAPKIKDIDTRVRSFFDEKTVIVGHNVSFDVALLERFFSGIVYDRMIDTYERSQVFLHFVPSFALEVLCEYLKDKPKFVAYNKAIAWISKNTQSYHDALYDAQSAASLFCYLVDYASMLVHTYPQMLYILKRSENTLLYDIIDITEWKVSLSTTIPLLRKSITTPQTMVKKSTTANIDQYPSGTQLYIGNKSPKDIATFIAQQKNIICVFSHKSKADIVKHLLHDMSVFGIASLYDESFFDQKRFALFMQKKSFSTGELKFISKYMSHYEQWLWIMDIQNNDERKIVYFLQERKSANKAPIVFATHNVLYDHIHRGSEVYKDYTICFFDQDRWYVSYNDFASHAYNPLNFLELIEKIVYTYDVCQQAQPEKYKEKYEKIQNFYIFLQLFIGILSIETKKIFTDYDWSSAQIDPILYHHHFSRTQQWRDSMIEWNKTLKQLLPEGVYKDIGVYIDQLENVLSCMVTIDKCMYDQSAFYFIYKETNRYVQRSEFTDTFASRRILYFSHYNKQIRALDEANTYSDVPLQRVSSANASKIIEEESQKNKKIFILSTQKWASQGLFTALCDAWIHKDTTVLAENISGWYGKSIFLAHRAENVILIGGYSFLLQCLAKRLHLDKTLVFFIRWSMEKLLLCDIKRYANRE